MRAPPANGMPTAASTDASAEAAAAMELDGLEEDQITALAELEVKKLASREGEVGGEVHVARLDAARARVKADFKVRKKGKR